MWHITSIIATATPICRESNAHILDSKFFLFCLSFSLDSLETPGTLRTYKTEDVKNALEEVPRIFERETSRYVSQEVLFTEYLKRMEYDDLDNVLSGLEGKQAMFETRDIYSMCGAVNDQYMGMKIEVRVPVSTFVDF